MTNELATSATRELTVSESNALDQVPATLQDFVRARLAPPIRSLSDFELEAALTFMIPNAYLEMGLANSSDSKVVTHLRETLAKDLRRASFEMLTLGEVQLFISRGIRGEYGTFRGQLNSLNIPNIHYWIRSGAQSRERAEATKEFNRLLDAQLKTSEVPLHLKVERSKQGLLNLFARYKETGQMDHVGFAYYDVLLDLKGVDYKGFRTLVTDEQVRKSITKEIKSNLEKKYTAEKHKAEKKGDLTLAASIGEFMGRLDDENEFKNKVKERFLKHYFDELIKKGEYLKF